MIVSSLVFSLMTRFQECLFIIVHAQDYSQHDFLIVVFYGYGFKDSLIVRNQQDAFEEDYVEVAELWQPFLGSRCQTLIDKPKFFIVSVSISCFRPLHSITEFADDLLIGCL